MFIEWMLTDGEEVRVPNGCEITVVDRYDPHIECYVMKDYGIGYSVLSANVPNAGCVVVKDEEGVYWIPCEVDTDGFVSAWTQLITERKYNSSGLRVYTVHRNGYDIEFIRQGLQKYSLRQFDDAGLREKYAPEVYMNVIKDRWVSAVNRYNYALAKKYANV